MKLRFFELAKRLSLKSTYKHRIGSIIVRKGKVLGMGFNKVSTHPRSLHEFKMRHAELDAILNSRLEDFKDCEIYIYRETPAGKLALSKPCKSCQDLLQSLDIKDIYYSDYDGYKSL